MAQQDPFDRRGRQILAVHPHPIGGAPGEVDPAFGIFVGEVPGPIHAVTHAFGVGVRVVVVTGEETRSRGVDQLADGFVGVGERTVGIEFRYSAFGDGVAVVDGDAFGPSSD